MLQIDDVQALVLNALYWDLAVPPHMVRVEVENGWVTMSGRSIGLISGRAPNLTRGGFLAWSASPIRFGSRRRMRSKGPLATRAGAIALTAEGSCKWAPEIDILEPNYRDERRGSPPRMAVLEETGHERHGRGDPRTGL